MERIGIAEILTIIFVVLKLVGVISWSWFWVLSPMIFGFIIGFIFFILAVGLGFFIRD